MEFNWTQVIEFIFSYSENYTITDINNYLLLLATTFYAPRYYGKT